MASIVLSRCNLEFLITDCLFADRIGRASLGHHYGETFRTAFDAYVAACNYRKLSGPCRKVLAKLQFRARRIWFTTIRLVSP
jgi:hypothetical protein